MVLHQRTVNGLLEVIRWVHTHGPWQDPAGFFSALHQVIPFDRTLAFLKLDATTYKILPSPLTLSNSGGDDAAMIRDYNEHFWRYKKPILDRITHHALPSLRYPTTPAAYLPKAQFQEFQSDFWRKHNIKFSDARYLTTPHGWLGVYLSRSLGGRDFSEEERHCLDLLFPHLELAVARQAQGSLSSCLFADGTGHILCLDRQAQQEFHAHPALAARLRTDLAGWIRSLPSVPLQTVQLAIRAGGCPYRIVIVPSGIGRHSFFLVSWTAEVDARPAGGVVQAVAGRFRLSPRERDVLACMVAGQQVKEMAQQLGLGVNTVKEYLHSLYRKVGVDGRGPLMAHLLSLTNAADHPAPLNLNTGRLSAN